MAKCRTVILAISCPLSLYTFNREDTKEETEKKKKKCVWGLKEKVKKAFSVLLHAHMENNRFGKEPNSLGHHLTRNSTLLRLIQQETCQFADLQIFYLQASPIKPMCCKIPVWPTPGIYIFILLPHLKYGKLLDSLITLVWDQLVISDRGGIWSVIKLFCKIWIFKWWIWRSFG